MIVTMMTVMMMTITTRIYVDYMLGYDADMMTVG